jgi:hypothetical protein
MNAHKKSSREKSSGKKKSERKKELKEKTVAAELESAVKREEAAKPAPPPAPAPVAASEAQASKKSPEPRPAPLAASEVKASKKLPEPRPAPLAANEARASKKPAEPRPAPRTEARPEAVESAVATIERSFKAAGRGTIAVNCKLLDFARENVNCGLDHVKDLAAARNPVRVMRLQMEYWHDCWETFANQAQELRALSAELVANANEPIREHMRRSLKARAA